MATFFSAFPILPYAPPSAASSVVSLPNQPSPRMQKKTTFPRSHKSEERLAPKPSRNASSFPEDEETARQATIRRSSSIRMPSNVHTRLSQYVDLPVTKHARHKPLPTSRSGESAKRKDSDSEGDEDELTIGAEAAQDSLSALPSIDINNSPKPSTTGTGSTSKTTFATIRDSLRDVRRPSTGVSFAAAAPDFSSIKKTFTNPSPFFSTNRGSLKNKKSNQQSQHEHHNFRRGSMNDIAKQSSPKPSLFNLTRKQSSPDTNAISAAAARITKPKFGRPGLKNLFPRATAAAAEDPDPNVNQAPSSTTIHPPPIINNSSNNKNSYPNKDRPHTSPRSHPLLHEPFWPSAFSQREKPHPQPQSQTPKQRLPTPPRPRTPHRRFSPQTVRFPSHPSSRSSPNRSPLPSRSPSRVASRVPSRHTLKRHAQQSQHFHQRIAPVSRSHSRNRHHGATATGKFVGLPDIVPQPSLEGEIKVDFLLGRRRDERLEVYERDGKGRKGREDESEFESVSGGGGGVGGRGRSTTTTTTTTTTTEEGVSEWSRTGVPATSVGNEKGGLSSNRNRTRVYDDEEGASGRLGIEASTRTATIRNEAERRWEIDESEPLAGKGIGQRKGSLGKGALRAVEAGRKARDERIRGREQARERERQLERTWLSMMAEKEERNRRSAQWGSGEETNNDMHNRVRRGGEQSKSTGFGLDAGHSLGRSRSRSKSKSRLKSKVKVSTPSGEESTSTSTSTEDGTFVTAPSMPSLRRPSYDVSASTSIPTSIPASTATTPTPTSTSAPTPIPALTPFHPLALPAPEDPLWSHILSLRKQIFNSTKDSDGVQDLRVRIRRGKGKEWKHAGRNFFPRWARGLEQEGVIRVVCGGIEEFERDGGVGRMRGKEGNGAVDVEMGAGAGVKVEVVEGKR